jgi:Fe-S oxidoreductase
MARGNISTLNQAKVKKIITPCPHCHNTLGNEYPQFGGEFEVQHHSQFLAGLVRTGKLSPAKHDGEITLHDPCYLARVNGETQATRELLGGNLREMPRHGARTFCCGAGGGRMWFEEPPEQRVSRVRAAEAAGTGAKVVATACPFCANMMSDGVSGIPGGEGMKVMDVAELLINGRPRG